MWKGYLPDTDIEYLGVVGLSGEEAKKRVERITADIEVGAIYEGKVMRIMDFGAFVNILPGKDGMVHISQLAPERIEKVTEVVNVG